MLVSVLFEDYRDIESCHWPLWRCLQVSSQKVLRKLNVSDIFFLELSCEHRNSWGNYSASTQTQPCVPKTTSLKSLAYLAS